jgi:uncharacterized protein (TIRG00374 family)
VKKTAALLLKTVITVLVIAYVIHSLGWNTITRRLAHADMYFFMLGILTFTASMILGAFQWKELLKMKDISISSSRAVSIYMTGIFFYNFMLGIVGGDAYKVAALHISGDSGKKAFASTFLDRFFGLLVITIFAIIGGGIILIENIQRGTPILASLIVLFLFSSIFIAVFLLIISQRLQRVFVQILQWLPSFPLKEKVTAVIHTVFINRRNIQEKKILIRVGIYSVLIQILRIVVHIFCAAALGIYTPERLPYFFIIIPIISLLMIIPLPFGVKEVIGGKLFVAAGFPPTATIMELLASLVAVFSSLAGGLTFILGRNHTKIKNPVQQPISKDT